MMMRMLEAGGLEVLTDNLRTPDKDNPEGYYEFERVKQIEHDKAWLGDARGRAVKIISRLLFHLPPDHTYKVVFMRRRMEELLASQRRMLARRGEPTDKISDQQMAQLFRKHLERVQEWLDKQPNLDVIYVSYNEILGSPSKEAETISRFFDGDLDVRAMADVVDPALYRQRG
jgi:broad-specificity NMP kinase